MSCRALGMGVEHSFIRHILGELKEISTAVRGHIVPTPRNIPVRNIYRDNGFAEKETGLWEYGFGKQPVARQILAAASADG
jgi:predicted enzyme involved in methoxymalonyl-ACP biosynthesis